MPHPVVGEEDLVSPTSNNMGDQQRGGQGGDADDGEADLEGPFLTLDEWMRAEERREARQRRLGGREGGSMGRNHGDEGGGLGGSRRGHGAGHGADFVGDDEETFALTSTGHAESSSPADPKKRKKKKKPSHGVAVGGHQHQHQHHKHQHHKHQEHQQPQRQGQGADHETTALDSSLSISSFGQQESQSSSLPEDFVGKSRLPSDSYARRSKIDTLKRERDAMRRTMARSELDLEPEGVTADMILRRYQFSVRANEGLEPSLNKDSGLASISSAPQTRSSTPLFPRGRPPSAPSLAPLPAQRPSVAPPHGANAPAESRPAAGASTSAARLHHQPILLPLSGSSLPGGGMLSGAPPAMLTGTRSQSPSGGGATPDLGIGFYEVKIAARDAVAPVDYTHDYRRFSYTDMKIEPNGHTPEGASTIDPKAMTEWLLRVFPRNQDDAYPMFLLCKDVLRKYHLKEYRYVITNEETYIKRVKTLQMAVEAAVAKQQTAVAEAEKETRRLREEVLEKDQVISRQV